jgi:hypothetical protein
MAQFTTTRLVDGRALVAGQDRNGVSGQTVVDATEWDEINADQRYNTAVADFDAKVEAFFAPLVEAAEAANKALTIDKDPVSYVVVQEAVEGTKAQDEILHHLSNDSIVLRLIEDGAFDRLVWVGDDLVVVAADTPLPVAAQAPAFEPAAVLPADANGLG